MPTHEDMMAQDVGIKKTHAETQRHRGVQVLSRTILPRANFILRVR